jgi:hypothetical protein
MSFDIKRLAGRLARTAAIACGVCCGAGMAGAQTAFYQASEAEIAGSPGTIIRQEPMFGAAAGASAFRVLYRSTRPDGRPIAVSGVIIIPAGDAPAGGWPIVAWAHPTTGIVPRCAPSLAMFIFQQIAGSRELLEQGYAIAATDYPGLGTPGPHPYLVGDSEARAVIDSVRAARSFPGMENSTRYAVSGGRNLTAMTVWSWARVFDAPIDKVVAPAAMPTVDRLATECIESIYDILMRDRTSGPLAKDFLTVTNPATLEPWHSLLAENTPGVLPTTLPVFLAQGSTDGLVRPQVTLDYMQRLCRAGSRVRMLVMPNVNHGFAGRDSAGAAVGWIADRFAGRPAPSDCQG